MFQRHTGWLGGQISQFQGTFLKFGHDDRPLLGIGQLIGQPLILLSGLGFLLPLEGVGSLINVNRRKVLTHSGMSS